MRTTASRAAGARRKRRQLTARNLRELRRLWARRYGVAGLEHAMAIARTAWCRSVSVLHRRLAAGS